MINQIPYSELKKIAAEYSPNDLVTKYSFEKNLTISRLMLMNDTWDESLQLYATKLLEEIKNKYPQQWNSHWKYEAFLGYAYDIILEYEKRYNAYKRAIGKASPPPPELLVAIAGCCWAPGKPPISAEEAIELVKQAIITQPYIEAIELLRGLYKAVGNVKEQIYWNNFLDKIKDEGPHLPSLDQLN